MDSKDLAVEIQKGLNTSCIGCRITYFDSLPSTMDQARVQVENGAPEGSVIIAGEQTGGRGRLKRKWLSPLGNIALSIILYPRPESYPYLVMIASLAVARTIESLGIKAQIKWPNDVLIKGKKVGGILIEKRYLKNKPSVCIVGVGINVAVTPTVQEGPALPPTSLEAEVERKVSLAGVIATVLNEFERLYLMLPYGKEIFKDWRGKLVTLGKHVVAISGPERLEGIAEDVDEDGTLVLRLGDGSLARIVAGDVSLREQ